MKKITKTKSITPTDRESLRLYFKDIYKCNFLPLEQEIDLSNRIKNGDTDALNTLVKSNLKFVITVAKQYQGQGLSLEDLISEGNIGLIRAAKEYDGSKGFKFISYAVWWIRQSIVAAIYNTSKSIRYPITFINKINKVKKAKTALERQLARTPTVKEISKYLNTTDDFVSDVFKHINKCSSLDVTIDDEEESTFGDMLPSYSRTDEGLLKESKTYEINQILNSLGDREQDIVRMYFGISTQAMSLDEIGTRFGMTTERVRQIKEIALNKLKDKYQNELKILL